MSNQQLVGVNEVSQALSQALVDVAMGRSVNKSKLQKQIDISDAINRRLQGHINAIKVMIECKKHGVDFANSMKEIRAISKEVSDEIGGISALNDDDEAGSA